MTYIMKNTVSITTKITWHWSFICRRNVEKNSDHNWKLLRNRTVSFCSACSKCRRLGVLNWEMNDLYFDNFDQIGRNLFGFQNSTAKKTNKTLSDCTKKTDFEIKNLGSVVKALVYFPGGVTWEEEISEKNIIYHKYLDLEQKKFQQGSPNCILRVQRDFLEKRFFRKKN